MNSNSPAWLYYYVLFSVEQNTIKRQGPLQKATTIDSLHLCTRRKQWILTAAHMFLRARVFTFWRNCWHPAADLRYQRRQGQEGRSWKYVCEDLCIAERQSHQVAAAWGEDQLLFGCPKDPKGREEKAYFLSWIWAIWPRYIHACQVKDPEIETWVQKGQPL